MWTSHEKEKDCVQEEEVSVDGEVMGGEFHIMEGADNNLSVNFEEQIKH